MGDTEDAHGDMMRGMQSSFGASLSSSLPQLTAQFNQLDIPQFSSSLSRSQMCHLSPNCGSDSNKRVGIPPSHPNQIPPFTQIPVSRAMNTQSGLQNSISGSIHSRSLSQPSAFSFDSLPPLSPSSFNDPLATLNPLPTTNPSRVGETLPPRKTHRRANSDIPFLSNLIHSSPPLIPSRENLGKPIQLVKKESGWEKGNGLSSEVSGERKTEGEVIDELFSAYMNLDGIEALNSSATDDKNANEDLDSSRASGTKTTGCDSSENEAESSVNESCNSMQRPRMSSSVEKREGVKRKVSGDIAPTTRHYRSISMDSFMGNLNLDDESMKFPPSPGLLPMDGKFSLDVGNGEFNEAEMKKIMASDKLAEIAMSDPKRAKRILANRQSAARSKERKMRYISELEHKVQTLQTEATTLSAQLTLLQRDSVKLKNQNNELKFRLQAMEQQSQLRDALNEALTSEVQRLKLAAASPNGEAKCTSPPMHHHQL